MTCPDCSHQFGLTFKRYFQTKSNVHSCPECEARSRLTLPLWVKVVEHTFLVPGVAAGAAVGVSVGSYWLSALFGFGWMAVNIPFNVLFDGRYGQLELVSAGRRSPSIA